MTHSVKPRLVDIARAAGVSLGTASNVFAHPEKVRPEVRSRVEAVAKSLGYFGPDPTARLLRAGKVNAIGIVAPAQFGTADTLRNTSFLMFMQGVAEVCDERGASLVILPDPERQNVVNTALVDGFIFGQIEHLSEIEAARLRRLPFAVVDFDAGPTIPSVRIDARSGGYLAAKHLIDLGHRRFAIMSFLRAFSPAQYHPPKPDRSLSIAGMPIDQDKLRGYGDALAEAGIALNDIPIVQAHPWDTDAASMLLDLAPEATAILSMSAMQGVAVIAEARRKGLSVPTDISVIGFNDIPEAAYSDPPLTVVDSRNTEKGRIAARMVFDYENPRCEILPARMVIRASTAPSS